MTEESLFADAIAISDSTERARFLDRACAGNDALRREVESLISAHLASNPLDRPAVVDVNVTWSHAPSSEKPGAAIAGRYKLLEEIGTGGMGAVWVAEQLQPVKRKVVLKLIKPGMDSRAVLARFEAERQALALMDHPNIAKVYDGGLTEAGRPFFVMEYVKGIPITEYCDGVRLRVDERLLLFIQVCQAVQHAHQKGVIHRDLKPSNILVAPYDGKPVPKVIDFGLAKAMHQPLTEKTLHTAHETVLGTPLYMSPEQAQLNNLDVDTRSDIYSLGVLLYELLTGTTPLDRQRFKEAAWDEIRRIIGEEEPPRPSARLSSTATLPSLAACRQTEPLRLTNLLRGDLDWIVMKALEKDRGRRYVSASEFAADVERYLTGDPVQAAPPSAGYRLRKFAHKHRRLLTTMAAFASVLMIATAISVWQAIRATNAEGVAELARQAAVADSKKAKEARDDESKARKEAQTARDALAKSSDELRRGLYASDMNLASAAWSADQPQRMIDLLERHRPKKDETELRGFEWHYWMRKLRSESRLVVLEGYGPASNGSDPRALTGPPMFGPSGRRCVQAWESADGQGFHLRVWDTSSGRLVVQTLITSPADPWRNLRVMEIGLTPDESRLHVLCFEAPHGLAISVQVVLDALSGKWLYSLPADELHFYKDNKRALSTRSEKTGKREIAWHDAATGKKLKAIAPEGMEQPFFSKNLERCAAVYGADVGNQREVRVYETATGNVVAKLPLPEPTSGIPLLFSDDGKRLAMGPIHLLKSTLPGQTKDRPNALLMWNVDSARQLWTRFYSPHGRGVFFVGDGKRCVSLGELSDPPVLVDTDTGRQEAVLSGVTSAQLGTTNSSNGRSPFNPEGTLVFTCRPRAGISVHSTATGKLVFEARFPVDYLRAAYAADGGSLFAVDDTGKLRQWDARDWLKPRPALDEGDPLATHSVLEPGMTILDFELERAHPHVTAVKEYDARTGRLIRTLGTFSGELHSQPDRRRAFFIQLPGGVLTFIDFTTGRQVPLWKRGAEKFLEIPTGYLLENDRAILRIPTKAKPVAGNGEGPFGNGGALLRLYDLKSGAEIPSWLNDQQNVEFCAPSPDGKKIALLRHVAGKPLKGPRELAMFDVDTGWQHWTIADLDFTAREALFSPQSRVILVSGTGPGGAILKVFDAERGELVCRLQSAGTKTIEGFSFSPDGRHIVGSEFGPYVDRLWDAETGYELAAFHSGNRLGPIRFDTAGHRLIYLRYNWSWRPPEQVIDVFDATPLPEEAAADK